MIHKKPDLTTLGELSDNGQERPPSKSRKRLISGPKLDEELDISSMTRWRWVKAGILPEPLKINNRNYFFDEEVSERLARRAAARKRWG